MKGEAQRRLPPGQGAHRAAEPSLPVLAWPVLPFPRASWVCQALAGSRLPFTRPHWSSRCGPGKTPALSGPLRTRYPRSLSSQKLKELTCPGSTELPSPGQQGGHGSAEPRPLWAQRHPALGLFDPQPHPGLLRLSSDTGHRSSQVHGRTGLVIKAWGEQGLQLFLK